MAWDDISNLWWLRTDNPNVGSEALQGLSIGMQAAQRRREANDLNNYRNIQAAIERDKLEIAKSQWESKTATEAMQGRGLTELNSFLARATADDKLADPATEAEFFKLTSRWAPYIPQTTVNSIYDNTFKAAKDRKAIADRMSGRGTTPAIVATDQAIANLILEADALEATDPDGAEQLRLRAEGIRNAARLTPERSGPPETGEFELPDGSKMFYYRDGKTIKTVPPPKNNMSDLERVEYTAELRALQAKYNDGDIEKDEFDKLRNELHRKFQGKVESKTMGTDPRNPLGLDLNLKQ